jgi:hypothetical protein
MVVTKSKGSSNKSENISKKPKSANNTSVDKHKMWLIAGITFVILAVVFLVLFPAIKEGVAGKAIHTVGGLELEQIDGTNDYANTFSTSGKDYELKMTKNNDGTFSSITIGEPTPKQIHCDNDPIGTTYNGNSNVCNGINGHYKVLLVGKNYGFVREDEIKSIDDLNYVNGLHACGIELSLVCQYIEQYTGTSWAKRNLIGCSDPIAESKYDKGQIFRAVCGTQAGGIPPPPHPPGGPNGGQTTQ